MEKTIGSKKEFWTLRYALINILYYMSFCTIHAFAAVFLLDKGFSNTEIGILLAVANIAAAFCQTYLAGLVDKSDKITNRMVAISCCIFILIAAVLLMFIANIRILIFVIFALAYTVQFSCMPILVALNFEYEKAGCKIQFGLARGLGSLGFATLSVFLGGLVENNGVNVILFATIIVVTLLMTVLYFFKKPESNNSDNNDTADSNTGDNAADSIISFAKRYPMFALLLIGVAGLYFGHNMLNDYLIQILNNIGQGETQMGYAIFIAALVELPAMTIVSKIVKKVGSGRLLVFAGIAFTVKVAIMYMARGMGMVYLSQLCQFFAYAVFTAASAYYVDETIDLSNQAKGQALITSAITVGGVFSSAICGSVIDHMGVSVMLMIGLIVSAIGAVIVMRAVKK